MSKVDMSSLNILVIDDEPFISKLIVRLLDDLGVQDVRTAEDGAEGIRMVKESRKKIDLIICDLEMPKMNGFEFVLLLRTSLDIADRQIPVVILTGHSLEQKRSKSRRAGHPWLPCEAGFEAGVGEQNFHRAHLASH